MNATQETPKTKYRSPETEAVRVAMIEQGLKIGQLAVLCGMKRCSLTSAFTSNFASLPARYKIEAAFGYKRAFWSDAKLLNQRRRCVEVFGFDPYLVSKSELFKRGREIGADFSGVAGRRSEYIDRVFARVAVSNLNSKPSTTPKP